MVISAKYEGGVFKPLVAVSVDEGTIVDISLPAPVERTARRFHSQFAPEFFGIWRDRTDIADSVEYVNALRHPRF